ncbi:4-hydroxy-tetrahydrodipicolinate synthase [Gammaproteobacteria bacterium]|nr:4-hydroxy-tetrahydrodipicolinate synthase [Gammaproteobacteria bacterium]MDC3197082.1 4-hydroxy-tetrahydrodipicolinate synthase [Gammaproteobacteria bacterium]HAS48803.1 4-hydroxy-tetrahydrodipicolinate synthase [Gammaproteobacteria bacterium]
MKAQIRGSIVAIVTPMQPDGSLDLPCLDKLLEWHIASGTNAVVIVGTTGESATLSTDEHCDLVGHCVSVVGGRIPVIAGTGSNNTAEALYFTESAKNNGADAALLVTPYYNRPSQEGLYQHFKLIAEGVDIPQILYNVPGRTACDLQLATIERLARLDNIVAIKDASGDLARGLELIERCGERLAIYSGEDALSLPLILAGADGTISVTANVAPDLMSQMCASALAGNEEQARAVDSKLELLHQDLFIEANPVPVKWALQAMGRIGGGIRLPLVELDGQYHVKVREALAAAGIVT